MQDDSSRLSYMFFHLTWRPQYDDILVLARLATAGRWNLMPFRAKGNEGRYQPHIGKCFLCLRNFWAKNHHTFAVIHDNINVPCSE
jgi:hypothetical protein